MGKRKPLLHYHLLFPSIKINTHATASVELASIPFTSLLKAKKKLSASAHASTSAAADQDAQVTSYGASMGRRGRDNARDGFGGPVQGKRANGSLLKADRASKHA